MEFTEEQKTEIENMAGTGWTVQKMAMYFDISPAQLQYEFEDKESIFRYHYDRGKLMIEAREDLDLVTSARLGNVTAIQMIQRKREKRELEDFKEKLLGGFE